ncbi:hypothetical protein R9C00_22345 [Flammeovirgaceae bacterium SG7u.111]|nr:hypothetical protein [Flammeovirgaceae bacterium SG7u.132]WPO34444.1 hypothetical protein R9C00_22345 [Flammeovirgaceae bacterium SG7u.111]
MKLFLFTLLFLGSVLAISSCKYESETNMNSEEMEQERQVRAFKKLSAGEISEAAFEKGKEIKELILSKKDSFSIDDCHKDFQNLLDEKTSDLVIEAKIVCDAADLKEEKAKMVWEAYTYNIQNEIALEDNLQEINGSFYYTIPKMMEGNLSILLIKIDKKKLIVSL